MAGFGVRGPRGYQCLSVFPDPPRFLMFQRVSPRSSRTTLLRARVAVLAASVGASAVLGAGVASAAAKPSWVDPVKKYTLSATFAQAGGMWQSTHSGQDFAVPSGTKVVAAH